MRSSRALVPVVCLLGVTACAVPPPSGPSVMALPPEGKPFDQFQQEDFMCRQYATGITGGQTPAQAASNAAVGSALVGTALGAGVGAALGSLSGAAGAGAAVGGAAGLMMGSAIGAQNAQASGASVQQGYDTAYTQCMYSRGNQVQAAPAYAYAPYAAPGFVPGLAVPYYPPAAYYYPPVVSSSIVIGNGWGYRGGWGGYYNRWGYRRW